MVLDIPFGLIPLDMDEVYPLSQNDAPRNMDTDSIEFIEDCLAEFSEYYEQVLIHQSIANHYDFDFSIVHPQSDEIRYVKDDIRKIKAIADYQFGVGVGDALFDGKI